MRFNVGERKEWSHQVFVSSLHLHPQQLHSMVKEIRRAGISYAPNNFPMKAKMENKKNVIQLFLDFILVKKQFYEMQLFK